jgi:hypothetical protein
MPELAVAAPDSDQCPTILFDQPYCLTNLHASAPAAARKGYFPAGGGAGGGGRLLKISAGSTSITKTVTLSFGPNGPSTL